MKFDEYFKLKEITLNITNYCNMKDVCGSYCKYCFEHNRNKKMMNKDDFTKIIDKCYSNYVRNYGENEPFKVSLFGGEPFANWDLIEYALKYSREKGYKIEYGVTTNLVHLTDHMIDVIEDYELGLLISIDGIRDIHNRYRSNSYDLVSNNIKRLVERGLKYLIEVRMTIMPQDLDNLLDSIKSIVDLGIVNIAPVPVSDTKWSDTDILNLEKALDGVWQWLIDIYNDNDNKNNISIKFIEDYIESVLVLSYDKNNKCSAGKNLNCSIGCDGEIYPCHQRHTIKTNNEKLLFGNFFDDDIKDVDFNNKETKSYYKCDDCFAKSSCRGGCPSENLTLNGDSNTLNKTQCDIYRTMHKVALKHQRLLMKTSNIRSHRLNVIKSNLVLLDCLINDVLKKISNIDEYKMALLVFYEKLIDSQNILLPSFEQVINNIINELKELNDNLFKG